MTNNIKNMWIFLLRICKNWTSNTRLTEVRKIVHYSFCKMLNHCLAHIYESDDAKDFSYILHMSIVIVCWYDVIEDNVTLLKSNIVVPFIQPLYTIRSKNYYGIKFYLPLRYFRTGLQILNPELYSVFMQIANRPNHIFIIVVIVDRKDIVRRQSTIGLLRSKGTGLW